MSVAKLRGKLVFLLIANLLLVLACGDDSQEVEREGWNNEQIQWLAMDEGLAVAKESNTPVLLVVYTDWCPHCKNYSQVFYDPTVVKAAHNFVMIRINQDNQPDKAAAYSPDGSYIPRTLILRPDGSINSSHIGPNPNFQHFIDEYQAQGVLDMMQSTSLSPPPGTDSAPPHDEASESADERTRTLGPFLSQHWERPVPAQGQPPVEFSEVEASLEPKDCGTCHPAQWEQWQSSLHAKAFSPGFAGQLIQGSLAGPAEIRSCQTCHTPLAEQQPFDDSLASNANFSPKLRSQGIICASCHVRQRQTFGPPRRPELPPLAENIPHAGFEARAEFEEARFCSPCHQFFDETPVNGKPIENTYAEWVDWKATPNGEQGETCQQCHMPDRAHLWRGIHDPEMVKSGIAVKIFPTELTGTYLKATLVIANQKVGHMFPTYVTPRVFLSVWQADAEGLEIPATRVDAVIGREIDFSTWSEVFDTRIAPGESVKLDYALERHPSARELVSRVTVDPDFHYKGVYDQLLTTLTDTEAIEMIREARRLADANVFHFAEEHLPLP
ncbi:MAG: thioredoxin family protein [Deltaproteobacteria bacterium]|nr:thioredoxin family protein [Deltaproteobacteria bacterium]